MTGASLHGDETLHSYAVFEPYLESYLFSNTWRLDFVLSQIFENLWTLAHKHARGHTHTYIYIFTNNLHSYFAYSCEGNRECSKQINNLF